MNETISDAMQRAEAAAMTVSDDETGEIILHNKPKLAGKMVVEILIAFFRSDKINKVIEEYRNGK